MKVREIMSAPVLTLRPSDPASDAVARMRDARVRHAVVVSEGAVVGVASERDFGGPSGGSVRRGRTVEDLMRRDPFLGAPELPVADAVALVRHHRIGCIPIVEDGELLGIVTRSDLLDALAARRKRGKGGARPDEAVIPRAPHPASPTRDKRP